MKVRHLVTSSSEIRVSLYISKSGIFSTIVIVALYTIMFYIRLGYKGPLQYTFVTHSEHMPRVFVFSCPECSDIFSSETPTEGGQGLDGYYGTKWIHRKPGDKLQKLIWQGSPEVISYNCQTSSRPIHRSHNMEGNILWRYRQRIVI